MIYKIIIFYLVINNFLNRAEGGANIIFSISQMLM